MSDRRKVWRTLIAKADAEASRAAAEVVLAENLLAELRASGAKLAIMRSDSAQRLVAVAVARYNRVDNPRRGPEQKRSEIK